VKKDVILAKKFSARSFDSIYPGYIACYSLSCYE